MKKTLNENLIHPCHRIPHLATAIIETVYNAIDAQASAIKLYLNLPQASFSVIDNGNGLKADTLFTLMQEEIVFENRDTSSYYGAHGTFLASLIAVADVEIESRARDEWIVHRKVFDNTEVVYNARDTNSRRLTSGVTISVRNLFVRLPIRHKLLSTSRYQQSALTRIRNFLKCLSLIWPKISFEIICENASPHSNRIGTFHIEKVNEYIDRLTQIFGSAIANELQYLHYATPEYSVCGYFGVTITGVSSRNWQIVQTTKHARICYQYAFLNNRPHASFQAQVSKLISRQIALTCDGCLLVFVLAVQAGRNAVDVMQTDTKRDVIFASYDAFQAVMTQVAKIMLSKSKIFKEISLSSESTFGTNATSTGYRRHKRPSFHALKADERREKSRRIEIESEALSNVEAASRLKSVGYAKNEGNDVLTRLKSRVMNQVLFPSDTFPPFRSTKKMRATTCTFSNARYHAERLTDENDRCCITNQSEIRNDLFAPIDRDLCQKIKRLHRKCQKSKSCNTVDRNLSVIHLPNILQPRKVSKGIFDHIAVLGQVDRKFILASTKLSGDNTDICVILAFDQHAVDERIKLEKLEKDLFGMDGTERNIERYQHSPGIKLWMNAQEDRALHVYEKTLDEWGFQFQRIVHEKSHFRMRESIDGTRLELMTSPIFDGRVATESDFREFVNYLLEEDQMIDQRPPMITRLIKSRACRSAIMFGEWLSHAQCQHLLSELSRCSLPFQCAHGRPSIAPLAEYQAFD